MESCPPNLREEYRRRIVEEATIYKGTKRELTDFEKCVNAAAAELCLNNVDLLNQRGELLQKARKKVSDDGYTFKKGRSCSKLYGTTEATSAPPRRRYDEELRKERLQVIDEEIGDVARIVAFKEKRISQAEAAKNYKVCEHMTEEIMELKTKKRGLEAEKKLLLKGGQRARARNVRKQRGVDQSDTDSSCTRSTTESRSVSPVVCSQVNLNPLTPGSSAMSSGSRQSSPVTPSARQRPQVLSPSSSGSRINPIECESSLSDDPPSPSTSLSQEPTGETQSF